MFYLSKDDDQPQEICHVGVRGPGSLEHQQCTVSSALQCLAMTLHYFWSLVLWVSIVQSLIESRLKVMSVSLRFKRTSAEGFSNDQCTDVREHLFMVF